MNHTWIQLFQLVTTFFLLWNLRISLQQDLSDPDTRHSSACFHSTEKTLNLTCPQGQMVRLDDIYYGLTTDLPRCHYTPDDCTMQLPQYADKYACVGRTTCAINLPTGDSGRFMPRCGQTGTYMQADYQCVPETEVHDICNPDTTNITGQFGYIKTPGYPNNYPTNQQCKLTITAPHPQQKIKLFAIDLTLEDSDTDCVDWLHIFGGHRAATICGMRARVNLFTTLDNMMELEFHSSALEQRKGFWLIYTAEPYMEATTTTASTATQSSSTNRSHDPSTRHTTRYKSYEVDVTTPTPAHNNTVNEGPVVIYRGVKVTAGAIVGLSVCLLLIITVIILVILVCRKKDTYNHSSKIPSTLSCNSEAEILPTSNNNLNSSTSHMEFSNSEFAKIYDEKGPNNIETAAAVQAAVVASTSRCEEDLVKYYALEYSEV